MRHLYFEPAAPIDDVLENSVDPPYARPGFAVPWDSQIVSFSGVFLHRLHGLITVGIETSSGKICPVKTATGLFSNAIGGKYPDLFRANYARYAISDIPVSFLAGGAAVVAVTEDGKRHVLASARFENVLGSLTEQDRTPTKRSALRLLRTIGLNVGTVIDVGVQWQTKELIEAFPDKKHVLFEPVQENYQKIRANYARLDHELIEAAASDTDGEGILELRGYPEQQAVTSSLVGPGETRTDRLQAMDRRTVVTTTVDSALRRRSYQKPFLFKLDVDGNEMKVLRGAGQTLQDTSCLIVEASLRDVFERGKYLEDAGFVLWDIVDLGYYHDQLFHVDLVFLSSNEKQRLFNPWRGPADRRKVTQFLH